MTGSRGFAAVAASGFVATVAAPTGVAATDVAAIVAAEAAAYAAGGGTVQLRAGTYRIPAPASPSSGGVALRDNVTLAGAGLGVTVLKVADGTTAGITGIVRTPSGVSTSNVTVRDLTIDGNASGVTGTPDITGFYCGVSPNGSTSDYDIRCVNVEIRNCRSYGFDPHERTTRLVLDRCISHDNGSDGAHDGFTIDACYDSTITNCVSYANGRHGFNFVTASQRVTVSGCIAYSNAGNGFTLQNGSKHITLSACRAYNNTLAGYSLNGVAQSGEQDNNPGGFNQLVGCKANGSGTHGFTLIGTSNNVLVGCQSVDASQTTTNTSDHFRVDESGSTYSTANTLLGCTWVSSPGASNSAKYGVQEKTSNDGPTYVLGCSGSGHVNATAVQLFNATSLLVRAHNGSTSGHPYTLPYTTDTPAEHGLLEWNFPLEEVGAGGGTNGNAGVLYLMKITRQTSDNFSKCNLIVGTAGATLTSGQCAVALFTAAGTRLATTTTDSGSTDLATTFTTTGVKEIGFGTISSTVAGDVLYVVVLTNGTTQPSFVRSGSTGVTAQNVGFSSGAGNLKFATHSSGLTAMPSSLTMSSMTATNALALWVALKV